MTGPTAARQRRMAPPDGRRTGRASAGGRTGTWNKNSNLKLESIIWETVCWWVFFIFREKQKECSMRFQIRN